MSYIGKVLQAGEVLVYETKLSWAAYIPGLLLLAAAVLLYLSALIFIGSSIWAVIVSVAVGAVALSLLAMEWFKRWTTEVAITDRRIILKTGFIRRDTIEMSIEKVESIDVRQSLLGRLLDYGDIIVRGTGAGFAPLRKIDSPLSFRSHVTGLPSKVPGAADNENGG